MKKPNSKASKNSFKRNIPEKQARLIGFIILLLVAFILLYKFTVYIDKNTVSAQQFVDLQQSNVTTKVTDARAERNCITGVFEIVLKVSGALCHGLIRQDRVLASMLYSKKPKT